MFLKIAKWRWFAIQTQLAFGIMSIPTFSSPRKMGCLLNKWWCPHRRTTQSHRGWIELTPNTTSAMGVFLHIKTTLQDGDFTYSWIIPSVPAAFKQQELQEPHQRLVQEWIQTYWRAAPPTTAEPSWWAGFTESPVDVQSNKNHSHQWNRSPNQIAPYSLCLLKLQSW